ncbi:hypothetical protein GCM10011579_096940 [Streptomyces albiflavescens]|uniref:Uncharacterized protein n=1 Tax=Streptomyces albiflavescens TaxID=1623582 RepID=A0A917YI62_9ACTN|nr:hypothetical protein GCM10011579_096940 [Streptomyces albiflavescens]
MAEARPARSEAVAPGAGRRAHRSCLTPPPPKQSEPTLAKAPDPAFNPDTGAEKWLVTRTRERYRAVQDLLAQGWTISAIGRELGLARHTAHRYACCENPEALADRAIRTTRLHVYRPYLISRWNQGCTNASALFREIQAQGYPGRTPQAVRRLLRPLRDTAKAAPAPPPNPRASSDGSLVTPATYEPWTNNNSTTSSPAAPNWPHCAPTSTPSPA